MNTNYTVITIVLAGIIAILRVLIEYDWWDKKEKDKSNGIWFAIVFVLCSLIYYVSEYNSSLVLIFVIVYWNVLELFSNFFHGKDIFAVGENTTFDKLLRKLTRRFELLKFSLHVCSILFLILLIL